MKLWQQPVLLLLSGAASVTAFAPLGWYPLGVLSLAVLFHGWHAAASARQAALMGFYWGLGCFLAGVSWVYVSMHNVGGMPAPLAACMTLLFAAYLALYPALAGWLQARWQLAGVRQLLLLGATWTLSEWLRGSVATGFPWLAVGYAHTPPSPLAGYAPLLGVYGVGFIVAVLAALLALLYRQRRLAWPVALSAVVLPLLGALLQQVQWTQPVGEPLTVSLLQGNVPQSLKWDPARLSLSVDTYAALAQQHPAPLVVLPETAIPLMFDRIPKSYLQTLAAKDGHVLIGAAVPVRSEDNLEGYANGAVLLGPQQQLSGYFKRHLVPFGEFVPPGLRWFLDLMHVPLSDFTAGPERQAPLNVGEQRLMPNICYEDLFGEELRLDAIHATVLVNLSNTAWFGDSLAQPQHLQIAQMRALETGRMMLRATNTGMTAAVNPDGTIAAALPPFTRGALQVNAQGRRGSTPYLLAGNVPVLLLVALIFAMSWRLRRRA